MQQDKHLAGSILQDGYSQQPGSIHLEFISKTFSSDSSTTHALESVSLNIEPGEFVAIMGQSGSGKSTLLNIIGLLDKPDSGKYTFGGLDVSELSQSQRARLRRQKFGVVFQNFNLLNRYRVEQNIELALAYQTVSSKAGSRLTYDLLEQLGLSDKAKVHPQHLSGGQAQRVAIARALINNPPIILADEPTGNLDFAAAQEISQLLKTLNAKGTTIVMVTHSQEVASAASRIVTMQAGSIVDEVKNNV